MITEKWSQYIIIVLILGIMVIGSAGLLRQTVISQTEEDHRLSVTGMATTSVAPDEVTILVGAETVAAEADDSQTANAGIISAIRMALNKTGIASENVTTLSYSLSIVQEYNKSTDEYEITGYKTVHMLQIKSTDLAKAGDYVDAAVSGGANRVDSVSFGLSDSEQSDIRTQLLIEAGRNARERAEATAQGIGVHVIRVVRANEGYVTFANYAPQMRSYGTSEAAVPTAITPGEVDVSASIGVTYEIA